MNTATLSPSAKIRSGLDFPVIDSDGHTIEFQPAFLDVLKEFGGARAVEKFEQGNLDRFSQNRTTAWYSGSASDRARARTHRPAWWGVPAANTLDRVTSSLPALLNERLDELGLDFTVLYPSSGLVLPHTRDDELRAVACRALNAFHARAFGAYAARMTPVAVIPMHTPDEAIAEMQYAVNVLGMKAIVMASYVLRPRADGQGQWYDNFCLDSEHDYDPVWAKCIELKLSPTFHSGTQGLGTRMSVSNYMYNHIGHFAASGEALCKAAFMGGVTRRFPQLRMAFLEGGAGWAAALYCDLVAHWKKRNRAAIVNYDPARLDQALFWDLHRRYGGELVRGRLEGERNRALALYAGNPFHGSVENDPGPVDEFERCGISRPEDVRARFEPNFFFGCEADDPTNAWAFDAKKLPYGARLQAIFSSDIGHWDVPEMRDVLEEAHELVEDGLITDADFRDFVFVNPHRFWTHANPDFFKGTVIERYSKLVPK